MIKLNYTHEYSTFSHICSYSQNKLLLKENLKASIEKTTQKWAMKFLHYIALLQTSMQCI
ncbi:hypothetical protein Syun_001268 [Stephania yunnanensis]|uniref:Uncharacterized protein n=1 Tax=Stephania yunnanensis TaxID=152371 RepID=A0AAP0LEI3_9MAGN